MSKLRLEDSAMEIVSKMSDGNPGAMQALCDTIAQGTDIDPQGFPGGLGAIMGLDSAGIYGTSVYILWADQCNRNTRDFVMLMRANQLGFLSTKTLQRVAADQMRSEMIDLDALDAQVCESLPEFQRRPLVLTGDES